MIQVRISGAAAGGTPASWQDFNGKCHNRRINSPESGHNTHSSTPGVVRQVNSHLEAVIWWGSGLSLLGLVATAVGIPWVVARLPQDYFNQAHRAVWRYTGQEPWFALLLGGLKNIVGAVLVLLGVIMLVTPGQGLLTLLVGLLLMNFPGKYHLERWLVQRPGVMGALNWLRGRRGHPPFDPPVDPPAY